MTITNTTPNPVIGEFQGKPIGSLSESYLKWLHVQIWLPWRYPDVVDYLNLRFRKIDTELLNEIDRNIIELFFWKFITYPASSELIAAIVKSAGAQNVLESGMFSGFTTLHLIKAVYPHGLCTAIDLQNRLKGELEGECHTDIFEKLINLGHFKFLKGSAYPCTDPNVGNIKVLTNELKKGAPYDFIFIDSSHIVEQTLEEIKAFWKLTNPGCIFVFHDCQDGGPMRLFVESLVKDGYFIGGVLPTCHRMDTWNPCNLGVFRRTDKSW